MSGDEESFVVLGSCSPGHSMSFVSMNAYVMANEKEKLPESEEGLSIPQTVSALNEHTEQVSSPGVNNGALESALQEEQSISVENTESAKTILIDKIQTNYMDSMAASFLLGDISADMLKSSIYSQFPSLSMEACADDVVKMQNLMAEYIKMKGILIQVSGQMKEVSERLHNMKEEMKNMQAMDDENKANFKEQQLQIATLSNQNLELKREIAEKGEQMITLNSVREKEHAELVQGLSEKSAQITNMAAQINELETKQLASFEYIPQAVQDAKLNSEYVARHEHERVVKDLERKTSVLLAEQLELSDMQKQYIDEINCLKVNLTASEELIKQYNADIALLKASDLNTSERFEEYQRERNEMREQLTLLQHQVEIYSKDFQLERNAREEMAGERTQLLDDLHVLQRKNQKLCEQVAALEKRVAAVAPKPTTTPKLTITPKPTGAAAAHVSPRPIRQLTPPSPTDVEEGILNCPICKKSCRSLSILQTHVNQCLDATT